MTDTSQGRTAEEREQRRVSLIEESLDADRIKLIEVNEGSIGALLPTNALQAMDFAKMMAVSGTMVPGYLRGNAGGCLGIVLKACRLRMDPFEVANWSYEVEQTVRGGKVRTVSYMSGFYNAVILTRAPTKDRPHFEIIGEGDERRCKVWATLRGEAKPREFISDTLAKLRPRTNEQGDVRGSPLWTKKPEVQLIYNAIRDFARIYFPDVVAGISTPDELEDLAADEPVDVTPPKIPLMSRLRPRATGEGFNHAKEKIEAEIASATATTTTNAEVAAGPGVAAAEQAAGNPTARDPAADAAPKLL
jgi:hypothetical protein